MPDSTSRGTTFLTRTRLILLALFGLGVMLWLGAATLVTRHLLHPPFLDGAYGDVIIAGEKPQLGVNPKSCCDAAFENLRLTDGAGASIDAWFVPGTVPAAVLLIPASGASKRAMLPYLRFLNAVGLPILVVDSSDFVRGRAGWGWTERGIISGAVGILQQKGYRNIAALGVSEGAATALMAQAEIPSCSRRSSPTVHSRRSGRCCGAIHPWPHSILPFCKP